MFILAEFAWLVLTRVELHICTFPNQLERQRKWTRLPLKVHQSGLFRFVQLYITPYTSHVWSKMPILTRTAAFRVSHVGLNLWWLFLVPVFFRADVIGPSLHLIANKVRKPLKANWKHNNQPLVSQKRCGHLLKRGCQKPGVASKHGTNKSSSNKHDKDTQLAKKQEAETRAKMETVSTVWQR